MQHFRQELREQKGNRKKITARIRKIQNLILWHWALVILALLQSGISLFIVTNYPGPYRGVLLVFSGVSFALALGLLLSGLTK